MFPSPTGLKPTMHFNSVDLPPPKLPSIAILSPAFIFTLISSRIFLIPVITSVSYEFIRFTGKYDNFGTKILSLPNIFLQKLTTNFPDKQMIEVSIVAMEYAIAIDNDEVNPEDNKFVPA